MKQKLSLLFSSPSRIVIWLIVIFVINVNNNQKAWKGKGVIRYDIVSYYSYLPAAFIDKDISLSFINNENEQDYVNQNKYWPVKTNEGKRVIKTTMGMAVLYAPFFFIAHFTAPILGYEATGFSLPYNFAIQFSGTFYLLLGLFFIRRILLRSFSEKATSLSLLAIYFASNLLCYSTLQAAYSHEYTFFLFSAFLYFMIKWLENQKLKYTLILGLIMGLMILVRSVNILFLLVFLLYQVSSVTQLKERLLLFLKNYFHLLIMVLLVVLIFTPQLLYWKFMTGHYLFNSYVGEWFYFSKPHIISCLIGFRKGWLIYSPVFIFALIGIYFLYKKKNPFFSSAFLLLPFFFYIISSWWCWWYGGSFGLRPMIDIYPLLVFPLALFFEEMFNRAKWLKLSSIFLLILFILLNCFQTIQFHYNVIHYDSMTFAAYKNRFFETSRFDCDKSLLQRPDYASALKGIDATVPFEGE